MTFSGGIKLFHELTKDGRHHFGVRARLSGSLENPTSFRAWKKRLPALILQSALASAWAAAMPALQAQPPGAVAVQRTGVQNQAVEWEYTSQLTCEAGAFGACRSADMSALKAPEQVFDNFVLQGIRGIPVDVNENIVVENAWRAPIASRLPRLGAGTRAMKARGMSGDRTLPAKLDTPSGRNTRCKNP